MPQIPQNSRISRSSCQLGADVFGCVAEGRAQRERLELLASFSLFGNVMSMASVQLAGAKRDALLLSFKDAKLSVVEYDPGTHDLKTLSLHYFEEPELRVGPQIHPKFTPNLPQIHPKFTLNLPQVHPKFTPNSPKFTPNLPPNLPNFTPKFTPNLPPNSP
uniref:RSE1/DDB1/CPSF1 first beta-propeller domain-containing protein n=1 Tax=Cyanistes caeruleus TaxID=156563 RepID=A0A8C0UTX3_CYACU